MSTLTFVNQTHFIAQFVVKKGEQVVARLPGIEPGDKREVPLSDTSEVLAIGDTHSIYSVINGVTTDIVTTTNLDATITAVTDTSDLEAGYFTLVIS